MPETVEVIEDTGVIKITSIGQITEQELYESRRAVLEICRQRGLTRVLVDATGVTNLSTLDAFKHASILAGNESFGKAKQAIVVSEYASKDLHFLETVAFNRGAMVRVFLSRDEALSWLRA